MPFWEFIFRLLHWNWLPTNGSENTVIAVAGIVVAYSCRYCDGDVRFFHLSFVLYTLQNVRVKCVCFLNRQFISNHWHEEQLIFISFFAPLWLEFISIFLPIERSFMVLEALGTHQFESFSNRSVSSWENPKPSNTRSGAPQSGK